MEERCPTPAVAVRRLTKTFPVPFRRRQVVAVQDLSLEVSPGQVYGLLGPNGSGKSTTLKVVLGLVSPTAGHAAIFGRDPREVASREAVGFLPENPYFYKHLTGRETLRFYGKLCGLRGADLRDKTEELLGLVRLEDAGDRRLGTYSKGMLQRVGLAQALVGDPRLLVLDEPTAGVDPRGTAEIRDLILGCRARGVTVLLCSHLLGQVQEICDRVGILDRGSLVREGRLEDLTAVDGQTELVLGGNGDAGPEEVTAEVARFLAQRFPGTKVLETRRPQRTLEQLFLDATAATATTMWRGKEPGP